MTTTVLLIPEDLDRHRVEVVGDRYRHLFRARRLKTGDRLRVVERRQRRQYLSTSRWRIQCRTTLALKRSHLAVLWESERRASFHRE